MSRKKRLRRTARLCLHCLRNLAFYRAANLNKDLWKGEEFWATAHDNFLDIATLEWSKIFGDNNAKHNWQKSVFDKGFSEALLKSLSISQQEFDEYIKNMRVYRDKFIAHLDEANQMNIPDMTIAIKSTQLLYQQLFDKEDDCNALPDAPANSIEFFEKYLNEANAVYVAKAQSSQKK